MELITRELASHGIGVDAIPEPQQQPPPHKAPSVDVPPAKSVYQAPLEMPYQQPQFQSEQLFQTPWIDNMDPDSMPVDRGMFEALSSFEPLSVRVGAIPEPNNQGTFNQS